VESVLKQRVILNLKHRIDSEISNYNSIKYIKNYDVQEYFDKVASVLYLYTRPKKNHEKAPILFAEIITAIGNSVRSKLKLKKDSGSSAKLGAFILYTFESIGWLRVILSKGAKHQTYIVEVLNDEAISDLWNSLPTHEIEKVPYETPPAPWTSSRHPLGINLVKTGNKEVLASLTPETHPIIFNSVNKSQAIGWIINKEVFKVTSWALKSKTEAFADIWELYDKEARTTKLREVKTIIDLSKRFLNKTFYHLYYCDFRCRKYPVTAYLHEQGPDLARALIYRKEMKPIGKEGFRWLMISLASNWGNDCGRVDGLKSDKISLKDRYEWAVENEEVFFSYAMAPKVNQGWMQADSPWQFLALCFELKNLREWQFINGGFDNYEFPSGIVIYIDGSNNGSQHLAALSRDEITAKEVNIVPQELPGDLYRYVGKSAWLQIEKERSILLPDEVAAVDLYISELINKKKQIHDCDIKDPKRQVFVEDIKNFKIENKILHDLSSSVFWCRITDDKHKRKIVKRNTMTLPYGGTPYGLGEQQIKDARKHGIELLNFMEHKWGAYLGRLIYENCRESLKRPMQLLSIFEEAGKKAEKEDRFLSWKVPITDFPVVQNYTEGVVKKIWIQYGPPIGEKLNTGYYKNTLQISICFVEETKPAKGKQSQGASPNIIHSLDAAHLAMVTDKCDFDITTIHDSYGCLLCDMPKLFKIVREQFVDLYRENPLYDLLKQIGMEDAIVDTGSLDITLVLDSEYAFV
jgi:DNA-directed RNA polymerase